MEPAPPEVARRRSGCESLAGPHKVASCEERCCLTRFSVAMTAGLDESLRRHLLRDDGQEDLCFALWRPSSGMSRQTSLLDETILPLEGERSVHGNASFETDYAIRAAEVAAQSNSGVAFLHSHPLGLGWQAAGGLDRTAESSIANLIREVTGLPLVGLTLAGGDKSWSARLWDKGHARRVESSEAESVRVIGDQFRVIFNERLRPAPEIEESQLRTVSAWGEEVQSVISRLQVLVVGAGSVGMIIAERLARTGIQRVAVMDPDSVEVLNLDRLLGATREDAISGRSKVAVALRVMSNAAVTSAPEFESWDLSICEPDGLANALDFDIIFSCVDRPWPRHVLNLSAYADLIPVLDGGVRIANLPDRALRNAYWRSHVVMPGRPCLSCLGQYDPALVQVERDGSLDTPSYIESLPEDSPLRTRQNVGVLSLAAASALLNHFLSFVIAPSGLGDPGPLSYSLATHSISRDKVECVAGCPYSGSAGVGDSRPEATGRHLAAEAARAQRAQAPGKRRWQRFASWGRRLLGRQNSRRA